MDDFSYRDGVLHAEDLSIPALADAVGTPFYVYSAATLRGHYDRLAQAFAPLDPTICFAVKSCANVSVLRLLVERGAGLDLVSGGELYRAQAAGVDPARCVYAGVGKTEREIAEALEAGVGWFNVESEQEFETLARVADLTGHSTRAALRVNPDVDPNTHEYTTTGKRRTKFGVDHDRARAFFDRYGGHPRVALTGLHVHIGSPVYDVGPYEEAVARLVAMIDDLEAHGHAVEMIDLGGGFGADYETGQSPPARTYAERIVPMLETRVRDGLRITLEPGRSIAANAGLLVVRVQYVKQSGDRTFVICDAGMNALMRPSHYGAFHFTWPVTVASEHVPPRRAADVDVPGLTTVDVVGPICETGDFLARDRAMPPVQAGDLVAVFSAGAYGMTMANHYNAMPLPPEVLVDGTHATIVREREDYEDLIARERDPRRVEIAG